MRYTLADLLALMLARDCGVLRVRRRVDVPGDETEHVSHGTEDYGWAEGLAKPLSTTAPVPESAMDEIAAAIRTVHRKVEPAGP